MRRLVIIIDALRYDAGKRIISPYFNGTCLQGISLSDWTYPAFFEIGKLMKTFCGNRHLLSGGGWVSRINWKQFGVKYRCAGTLFPLKDWLYFINRYKKLEDNTLFVIHDYWVHQWYNDMPDKKVLGWKTKQPLAPKIYNNRVHKVLPLIERVVNNFKDWDIYITSDHSELMWETEGAYHHNYLAKNVPLIKEIPIISLNGAPLLAYSQLFTVSDIDDLVISRSKQLEIRVGYSKFDSIKYINENVHI